MRLLSGTVVLVLSHLATASAQTLPPEMVDCKGFDDGSAESVDKVSFPSGALEWFSVDFDATCASSQVVGICLAVAQSCTPSSILEIGIYPDNLTVDSSGETPDVTSPLRKITNPTPVGDACEWIVYEVPKIHLGSTGVHVALRMTPGDSCVFLCNDTDAPSGRSYSSSDGFATAATPVAGNVMLRLAQVPPAANDGTLLLNHGQTAITVMPGDRVCFTFYGCMSPPPGTTQRFVLQTATNPPVRITPILPMGFIFDGPPRPGPCPDSTTLCGEITSDFPQGFPLPLQVLYADPCHPTPTGNPRIKLSNVVTITRS